MLKICNVLLGIISVIAIVVLFFTIFCQLKLKNSNWQIVRLISNSVLIFSTLGLISIRYFIGEFDYIDLITLLLWIINFAISYKLWQNSKHK